MLARIGEARRWSQKSRHKKKPHTQTKMATFIALLVRKREPFINATPRSSQAVLSYVCGRLAVGYGLNGWYEKD